MSVKLFVEGGGSREQDIECRRGFNGLISGAGFAGRMPRIVAAGPRRAAYDSFVAEVNHSEPENYALLLVDSEDPVQVTTDDPDSSAAWDHLRSRAEDNWPRPPGTANDQAQLMVTSMETWIAADHAAVGAVFGFAVQASALLPLTNLEVRTRRDVLTAPQHATRNCPGPYAKGSRSFEALAHVNPAPIRQALPFLERFLRTLDRHLPVSR